MQWIDGPDKTGSNGVGDEDLGVKAGEDESVGRGGALQLEVQELELEQQPASQECKKEIHEASPGFEEGTQEGRDTTGPGQETRGLPLDRKENTREAPSDSDQETQGTSVNSRETPNPEGETREAPSDPGVETEYVAGRAEGSTNLEGLVVPARRKLTTSGNLPPNNVNEHVKSTGARRRERAAPQSFLRTNEERDEENMLMCDGGGTMGLERKVDISEPTARGMSPEE